MAPPVQPAEVGHDGVAVEQSHQGGVAEGVRRLLPCGSRGVAVVLGADLDEQPDPATGSAGVVEQRLDRLLVVFFGLRAFRGESVDLRRNVGDSFHHPRSS